MVHYLSFVKAKSEVSPADVRQLVEFGLDLFHSSQNKLHVQVMMLMMLLKCMTLYVNHGSVRWGSVLVKLLMKHGKKLGLTVEWRPFYDCLTRTHFKSLEKRINQGLQFWVLDLCQSKEEPEEEKMRMRCCWIKECLDLWETLPNCQFWDIQWTSFLARCIKSCKAIDWEQFLPALFSRYLNMFEVPVSSGSGSYPFALEVPRNMKFLFSSKSGTPAKAIAKSIVSNFVYLLKPSSSAQEYFERLANLLEQYSFLISYLTLWFSCISYHVSAGVGD
ncbi:hypothetical protein BHE74_00036140 [Ensete ventricosum]|nr:hypothetical protein BHE74_00036140 [Ensete ventricosum]RZR97060.1 hypothetical protein BHM03_00026173 [Ensete ventricosum]